MKELTMPILSDLPSEAMLSKTLAIGYSMVGKSEWAANAAKAGFNVLFCDGDVAKETIRKLPREAAKRIRYMNVKDSIDKPRFGRVMSHLLTGKDFYWNDTEQKTFNRADDRQEADKEYWCINLNKFTHNDVFVPESDLSEPLEQMQLLTILRHTNPILDWMVGRIRALNCHVIVPAHVDEYTKYKKHRGVQSTQMKEMQSEIEFIRQVPKSSSRPHSLTLAKNFTEVLWFELQGLRRYVDPTVSESREGGSRSNLKRSEIENLQFIDVVKAIGGAMPQPDADMPGVKIFKPGESISAVAQPTQGNQVINAGGPAALKVGGLAALVNRKPQ
jgi:hypothetical protein